MSTTREAIRMKSHKKNQPLQLRIGDGIPKHVPLSGQTPALVVRDGVTLLQLNVEGLTKANINVLTRLAQAHAVTAILLHETHHKDRSHLKIPGHTLAACTESEVYGTATFVKHHAKWSAIAVRPENSLLEWTATEVEGVTIINVYKPPSVKMDTTGLPYFSRPCMYVGDFNCHSTTCGHRSTNASGEAFEDWAFASGLNMLHDPKQPDSFHSRRQNTGTNSDLAFVNLVGPLPHRTILQPFPKSQQRPSLIQPINPIEPLTAKSVLRWNFRKEQFTSLTELGADSLPDPSSNLDMAYSTFCGLLHSSARMSIPRGCRRQYILTWDSEGDQRYNAFLLAESRVDSDLMAEELTSCPDRKRREQWIESVEGIDFAHSSRKAWKTFNRRTGRYESPRQCPITANAIARQLLANGCYAGASKAHSLNVKQQCSALWKSPGFDGHLTSPFTSEELAHAIKLFK